MKKVTVKQYTVKNTEGQYSGIKYEAIDKNGDIVVTSYGNGPELWLETNGYEVEKYEKGAMISLSTINAFYGAKVYGDNGIEITTLPHRTEVEVVEPFGGPAMRKGEYVKIAHDDNEGWVKSIQVSVP